MINEIRILDGFLVEQVNNYSLGFKADRKILVKLYLEKVEKQVEELVSSELVKSIRRLIDLTDYHILGASKEKDE
jgi:hypothetical protein